MEHFSLHIAKDKQSCYKLTRENPTENTVQTNAVKLGASSSQEGSFMLKTTKQVFLSTNNYLLYQINDFPQSSLVYKRSPQFQINVYRVRTCHTVLGHFFEVDPLYLSPQKRELVKLGDFVWLIKRQLYLSRDTFFDVEKFELFFQCVKFSQKYLNAGNLKTTDADLDGVLANFKRLRIMCLILGDYFEMVSSFDFENIR